MTHTKSRTKDNDVEWKYLTQGLSLQFVFDKQCLILENYIVRPVPREERGPLCFCHGRFFFPCWLYVLLRGSDEVEMKKVMKTQVQPDGEDQQPLLHGAVAQNTEKKAASTQCRWIYMVGGEREKASGVYKQKFQLSEINKQN